MGVVLTIPKVSYIVHICTVPALINVSKSGPLWRLVLSAPALAVGELLSPPPAPEVEETEAAITTNTRQHMWL